jgi:hypothetical protein
MITPLRKFLLIALTGGVAALLPASALAQAAKATPSKPTFDDLQSPEFGGAGARKAFRPRNWLEVEAKFRLAMKPEPASKMAERVLVRWFVAVKNPEKSGTALLLLSKEVQHANVPLDQDIYSSVYLSPASLQRLTGSDRAGKGAVEFVGYEIVVNGEVVGEETSGGQVGWWKAASDKISRSETVPLLNKAQTPFSNMWWDRYAEIYDERG